MPTHGGWIMKANEMMIELVIMLLSLEIEVNDSKIYYVYVYDLIDKYFAIQFQNAYEWPLIMGVGISGLQD